MKATISSKLLRGGLSFVSRMISRRSVSLVQFHDGKVVVGSGSGKAWHTVGDFSGHIAISPSMVEAALANGSDELVISSTDSIATLTSGTVRIKAPLADPAELPNWNQVGNAPVSLPHLFIDAVEWGALLSHPDEASDFNHVHIGHHEGKLVAFGTDRSNVSVQLTDIPWEGREPMFIPTSLVPMVRLFEGDVVVDSDTDKIQVQDDNKGFISPLFHDRRTASWSKVHSMVTETAAIVSREKLLGLMRAFMGVNAPSGKGMSLSCAVELKASGQSLHLLGGESFEGAADANVLVEDARVTANAIPIISVLSALDCDDVAVCFSDPKSTISIHPAGNTQRISVMAPLRRQ